jgi:hypothetical protein
LTNILWPVNSILLDIIVFAPSISGSRCDQI